MQPRVIVNCACSADGKLASRERRQVRISSEEDMRRVHTMRCRSDAVLVGVGTVLADDPKLTVKEKFVEGSSQPMRVVLDPDARTPPGARVLGPGGPTLLMISEDCRDVGLGGRRGALLDAGAEVMALPGGDYLPPGQPGGRSGCGLDLSKMLEVLGEGGVRTLMVEGGGRTIWSFFRAGLVDELHIFHGSIVIGGEDSPTVVDGGGFVEAEGFPRLELVSLERMDGGYLTVYHRL